MVEAQELHYLFSVPIGITISILGLVGNTLSALVWSRLLKDKFGGNMSTGLYLFTLALADTGLLIFFLTTDSLPKSQPHLPESYSFCAFYCYVGYPLLFFFIVFSIWLIVAVTINRALMVLFPMKARTLCSTTRATISICTILACCFIINVPHFFNYRPKEVNGTYVVAATEYGKDGGSMAYEFWVHCMFLVLVPWVLIAFFNSCIIVALIKRAKQAGKEFNIGKNSKRHSQDRQMTLTLLSVTFMFLILLAWQCVTQCFYMLGFGKANSRFNHVDKSFAAAKIGVVINSSTNFLLYCCNGSAFRHELGALFGVKQTKVHAVSSTTPSTTKITITSKETKVERKQSIVTN